VKRCNSQSAIKLALAGLLIGTLDLVFEADVEAAWSEKIRRRVTEIDTGPMELILWEEVPADLFPPVK